MTLFHLGWEGIFDLVRNDIPWLLWITSVLTWTCWGSFLQAVSYRIPNGISIVVPESHCPECKRKLLFQDNLPIFGWLGLKGKCRFCHTIIPIQYLWVEIGMGCLGALMTWVTLFKMNSPLTWLWALMITSWLVVLGLIDYHHKILPDGVTLPPLIVATLIAVPSVEIFQSNYGWLLCLLYWLSFPFWLIDACRGLVGVLCGEKAEWRIYNLYQSRRWVKVCLWIGLFSMVAWVMLKSNFNVELYRQNYMGLGLAMALLLTTRLIASKIAREEAMGLGDVKMAMVLGWWFGPWLLLLILGFACILGVLFAMIQKFREQSIAQPFGTMMAISAFFIGVCYPLLGHFLEMF